MSGTPPRSPRGKIASVTAALATCAAIATCAALVTCAAIGIAAMTTPSAWAADNVAVNKSATGSTSCNADEGPAKAVNGSVSGGNTDKWCSAAEGTKFLQVDLGSVVNVGRFVVKHAGSGGEATSLNTRAFTVDVSVDGTSFSTVVTVTANTADVSTHDIAATSARFIRLNVTSPEQTGTGAARIYEFEVYLGLPPVADPTPTEAPPGDCHADATPTVVDYVSDHRDAMTRVSCNADVAVYFDDALRGLPAAQTAWIAPFVTDMWRHYRETYGSCAVPRDLPAPIGPNCVRFGHPKPLMAFLHQNKHFGGTVANRFDAFSGFRNTIDVGDNGWQESNGTLRDELTHEGCHIVEGASQGVHESPAFEVWGDSKWAEICQWDFYQRTGRTADAKRTFDKFTGSRDGIPSGATNAAWFKDWFYPLWQETGGNMAYMERFFGLLSQYFPKRSENEARNFVYSRRMTTGEFVHFMSGAVGRNLSTLAAQAFNTGFSQAQFNQARTDFPSITY